MPATAWLISWLKYLYHYIHQGPGTNDSQFVGQKDLKLEGTLEMI